MIQPKPFLHNINMRTRQTGKDRRIEMSLRILEKGTPLPLPVEYKDIDLSVQNWVENELKITYDGELLPTFKMFANQRINEYAQTWKHVDENGNLLLNFKTITRDNNPQKGDNQGSNTNIPGDRDYPMFLVPTLEENQQMAYDMYSMKQPFSVNLEYTVYIITNKYELLNQMNLLVHDKFKSINCFIYPNNHPMPMTLENITDDSEYSLDDRKYYSQSYKIKVKAYIIKESDFKVTKIPSRYKINTIGDKRKVKNNPISYDTTGVWDDETRYQYKKIVLTITFDGCTTQKTILPSEFIIRSVETSNVYDFLIFINGEKQNLDDEIHILQGDELSIKITKDDMHGESKILIAGFDPNVIYDTNHDAELSLDEDKTEYIDY